MTSATLKNRALKLLPKGTDPETIHKVVLTSDGGLRVTLVTGNIVAVRDKDDPGHTTEILTGPPPHESVAVSTPVLLEMRTEVAAAEAKGTHPRGDTATGQNAGGFDPDGEPLPVVMPKMEAPDPSIVANFESLTDAELEKLAEQIGVEWTGQKDQAKVMEAIVRHNVEFSGDKATGANIDHRTRDGDPVPVVHPAYPNDFEKAVTEPEKAGYRDPDDIPKTATRPSVVGTPESQAAADAPSVPEQFPEASLKDALENPEGANVPTGDPDAAIPLAEVLDDDSTPSRPRPTKAPSLNDLTKVELQARLDAAGIEYRKSDTKPTLVKLLKAKG